VGEKMCESCSRVYGKQNQIIANGCKVHDHYESPLILLAYAHQIALFDQLVLLSPSRRHIAVSVELLAAVVYPGVYNDGRQLLPARHV
jgi:hypothetical protein